MGDLKVTHFKDGVPVESLTMRDQRPDGRWYEQSEARLRRSMADRLHEAHRQVLVTMRTNGNNDVLLAANMRDLGEYLLRRADDIEDRIR